jgi:hypothetical protein
VLTQRSFQGARRSQTAALSCQACHCSSIRSIYWQLSRSGCLPMRKNFSLASTTLAALWESRGHRIFLSDQLHARLTDILKATFHLPYILYKVEGWPGLRIDNLHFPLPARLYPREYPTRNKIRRNYWVTTDRASDPLRHCEHMHSWYCSYFEHGVPGAVQLRNLSCSSASLLPLFVYDRDDFLND